MTLIALTGGIAAGKSTIGRRLEALGAVRIDADQLAREAVAQGSSGLARIVAEFGESMVAADGSLDRAKLGAHVFGDQDRLSALNAIVHPEVRDLAGKRIAEARAADPDAVIAYEIPLLVETGALPPEGGAWDLIVVAEADARTRAERLVELRGMDRTEAERRIGSQASDEDRRSIADIVIDTSATESETVAQTDRLWDRIRGMHEGSRTAGTEPSRQ
ncbi:dephospho-CoA kinase [Leucobacter sp. GX24907]